MISIHFNFIHGDLFLKTPFFLILMGSLIPFGNAQDLDLTTYDTEEGGLYFDQALIYSYSDHTGLSEEVWIYYSTCSKRLLFDHAAWGREDEMVHYVIAQPDGSYLTFGTEAEGPGNGKVVTVDSVYLGSKDQLPSIPPANNYIEIAPIPGENEVVAGLESKAYAIRKLKDINGSGKILLATVDFDTRMIYLFNQRAHELRLPEVLGQSLGLGADQLVTRVESSYTDSKGQMYWSRLELETIDPTTYWAPFRDYVLTWRKADGSLLTQPLKEVMTLAKPCY